MEGVSSFDVSGTQVEVDKRHPYVLAVFLISFGTLMYGCITRGWGLVETAVCLFWMAFIGGLIYGYDPSTIAKTL